MARAGSKGTTTRSVPPSPFCTECGFCCIEIIGWQERINYIANHYTQHGKKISEWKNLESRGHGSNRDDDESNDSADSDSSDDNDNNDNNDGKGGKGSNTDNEANNDNDNENDDNHHDDDNHISDNHSNEDKNANNNGSGQSSQGNPCCDAVGMSSLHDYVPGNLEVEQLELGPIFLRS